MYGDYNSDYARLIQVRLNRCVNGNGIVCAEDDTIRDYLRSTMMGTLANNIRFDPEYFGAESIVRESRFFWNSISTQV